MIPSHASSRLYPPTDSPILVPRGRARCLRCGTLSAASTTTKAQQSTVPLGRYKNSSGAISNHDTRYLHKRGNPSIYPRFREAHDFRYPHKRGNHGRYPLFREDFRRHSSARPVHATRDIFTKDETTADIPTFVRLLAQTAVHALSSTMYVEQRRNLNETYSAIIFSRRRGKSVISPQVPRNLRSHFRTTFFSPNVLLHGLARGVTGSQHRLPHPACFQTRGHTHCSLTAKTLVCPAPSVFAEVRHAGKQTVVML